MFGWDVTVIARPRRQAVNRIRSDSPFTSRLIHPLKRAAPLQRLWRACTSVLYFPDNTIGWLPYFVLRSLEASRKASFDAIMSSALPATMHLAAAIVSRARHLPWLAEYRDLWIGYPYKRRGPLRRWLESALERRALRNASAIVTVSKSLAKSLRALHSSQKLFVAENAYDLDEWTGLDQLMPKEFLICYAGRLYGGARSPELLFTALAQLKAEKHPAGDAASIAFYGSDMDVATDLAARFDLTAQVRCYGIAPRQEVLRAERAAAILLLLLSNDPATLGEFGSKIFEYVGAGRPVLAIGPPGSVNEQL